MPDKTIILSYGTGYFCRHWQKVSDSTVIIVAQRISTVLHAEQILVMDEGRIVGRGTHEELLANCEVYRQIAKSQMSEKELGLAGDTEREEQ